MIQQGKKRNHFLTKSGHYANNLTKEPNPRYMLTLVYSDGSAKFPRVHDAAAYVTKVLYGDRPEGSPKLIRASAHDSQHPLAGDAVIFTEGILETRNRYDSFEPKEKVEDYPF